MGNFRYKSDWVSLGEELRRGVQAAISSSENGPDHNAQRGLDALDQFSQMRAENDRELEDYLSTLQGSTINVAGNPALSGAVILNAGSGINLTQSGQNVTIGAAPQQARGFSAFFPGTLAAATVQKLIVPSAVLTQLDIYLQTAPASVSSSSCANVVVSGATSGSLTLPLSTSGQQEYHLQGLPASFGQQRNIDFFGTGGAASDPSGANFHMFADTFTATASGQIGSVNYNCAVSSPTAGDFIRAGIATAQVSGGTIPAFGSIPWVNDIIGNPAYVDIPVASLPTGASHVNTLFQLANPVNIASGTAYSLLLLSVNSTKTGYGSTAPCLGEATTSGSSYSGNISTESSLVAINSSSTWASQNGGSGFHYFNATGVGTGVPLSGLVSVAITLTGTPASPGANANIAIQM